MRNKRIAAFLAVLTAVTSISAPLSSLNVLASTRLTLTEGSGSAPDVQIIRMDENGNEIADTNDVSKYEGGTRVDSPEGNGEENSPSSGFSGTNYEGDIRGLSIPVDMSEREDVYISTADDLIRLARDCSLDVWSRDKNVILKNDIDISGSDFKHIPIFSGIFDGQGYTISGLSLTGEESYVGLFCIAQTSAVIKNLNVEGFVTPAGKPLATGGIVGDNYGLISNCCFNGSVEGYDYTGTIVGYNEQTGNISSCRSLGHVLGYHFTGGIAGYNLGMVNGCSNSARVNITSIDETFSISDIDLSKYTNNLLNVFGDNNKQDATSIVNSTVDIGGICGYSQGTIVSCTNDALIGYEHFGYNVGGIVGRQNGYVQMCVNNGEVYGRKDVGGIAGQAEPYVIIDITKDIVGQLTSNMNSLHDLVNVTLNDAGSESDIISTRLNMVKNFTDKALNDTSYLTDETSAWINSMADSGNEFVSRIDYALQETAKNGGALDHTRQATEDAGKAMDNLTNAVNDLDIQKYLSSDESVSYNSAKDNLKNGTSENRKLYDKYYESDYKYNYNKAVDENRKKVYVLSSNLVPLNVSGNEIPWPSEGGSGSREEYSAISRIVHKISDGESPEYIDFPSDNEDYNTRDKTLNTTADAKAVVVVEELASDEFRKEHGGKSYTEWMELNVETMSDIIMTHESEMSENTRRDVHYAFDSTKHSVRNLGNAVGDVKSLISDINSRGDITIPKLSDEYRNRSQSLIANIQGMSDNLGFLNNEVNSSNQQLVDDLIKVNDQFNVIMLLIADAIDGVLDADYTNLYEDDSLSVAENSTDATISDSLNNGSVHGDINTAGIAGTMAIEYDFDLESDITGIKDATAGTTYRTKCVLRNNKNTGYIEGVKSCVGGTCGLQEMGTVLRCQNYGKLNSKSGDYVGGISGKSLSIIKDCRAKCILKGNDNIGGITGLGYDISGCYSLPTIVSEGAYLGAVAGDNSQKGRISANYFVSDDYAGINRVSFSGKAEPITYRQLLSADNIPSEFRSIRVSFVVDDEVISVKEYEYGDSIDSPPDDTDKKEYILWDWDSTDHEHLHSDTELTGTRSRYVTTLAGMQLRENGQSAVLVDGRFVDGDTLRSKVTGDINDPLIFESWELNIPDDSADTHMIRYCPPSGISDINIWILEGNERTKAEISSMGRYYTFNATGNNVRFLVENAYENPLVKYADYEAAGLAVIFVLICILIRKKRRKSGRTGSGTGQKRKKNNRESDGINANEEKSSMMDDANDDKDLEMLDLD